MRLGTGQRDLPGLDRVTGIARAIMLPVAVLLYDR
jgi:hypothetical protein